MALNMGELKKAAADLERVFHISGEDSRRIVAYFVNGDGMRAAVADILAGNYSEVGTAADALGISIQSPGASLVEKKESSKKISKPRTKTRNPKNAAEVSELPRGELPADILETVDGLLTEYCARYAVEDLRKATASVWRGACMYIGQWVKASRILENRERERVEGGKIFDPERVAALLYPWASLCASFDKAPLAADFIAFSGVSASWFYCTPERQGRGVTSAGGYIWKKLLELQEQGLAAVLVDGRRNPTGTIFFLKNWHGWKDQREVIHTDGGTESAAAALPVFNVDAAGLIEEKPTEPQ